VAATGYWPPVVDLDFTRVGVVSLFISRNSNRFAASGHAGAERATCLLSRSIAGQAGPVQHSNVAICCTPLRPAANRIRNCPYMF